MLLTHRLPLPAKVHWQQTPAVFVAKPLRHKPASNSLISCAAPRVAIEFNTAEGPVKIECESGDILRDVMLDQKVDLYTTWGKVLGDDALLSEKNDTELKKLKRVHANNLQQEVSQDENLKAVADERQAKDGIDFTASSSRS